MMIVMLLLILVGCDKPIDHEEVVQVEPQKHIELSARSAMNTTTTELVTESEPHFKLSANERYIVECVVMGEARGESDNGKVLVAQCILNACVKDGIQPSEVRTKYQYAGFHPEPSEEVKAAVSAVFDYGYKITEEPILYFYAPRYCSGGFHETQCYVLTEGNHKFFKEWE